jgi:hypothetical protein
LHIQIPFWKSPFKGAAVRGLIGAFLLGENMVPFTLKDVGESSQRRMSMRFSGRHGNSLSLIAAPMATFLINLSLSFLIDFLTSFISFTQMLHYIPKLIEQYHGGPYIMELGGPDETHEAQGTSRTKFTNVIFTPRRTQPHLPTMINSITLHKMIT